MARAARKGTRPWSSSAGSSLIGEASVHGDASPQEEPRLTSASADSSFAGPDGMQGTPSPPNAAHFVDDLPCIPRRIAVLRLLGYRRRKSPIGPEAERLLQEAFHVGPALLQPRAVWATTPCDEQLTGHAHPSRPRVLAGAARLVVAVCTIGSYLEHHVADLSRTGELALASVIDALGSEAVETLAQNLQRRIRAQLPRAMAAGNRLSPGYRGWPVEEQAWLFRLVPTDRIGVSLTPGFMMIPRKSISFVMKLRAKENHK
jgi:hypothetical protein